MTGYFSPAAISNASGPDVSGRRRGLAWRLGAPMVSLSALIWAAPALAQTTIGSGATTPLATSTAGDITINVGGSVKPAAGTAVTIDSNNSLTNNGLIEFQNLDHTTGVLARGGHTGAITNDGTIQVDDTFTAPTDSRGIPHGPFAKGTDRFGVRIIGPGDFNGDVVNQAGGTITVKGDNSAAVSI